MKEIFYNIHHYLGMLTLVFILLFTIVLFIYFIQGRGMTGQLRKISLVTISLTHLQAIIGIVLLIMSFIGNPYLRNMKDLMGVSMLRQKYVEHPVTMIIVAIILTIVSVKIKKVKEIKFISVLMSVIALALTIGMIPRTFWNMFG